MKEKIEKLLSKEYYCTPAELNKKEVFYSVNTGTEKPFIKIMAYKNCVVVCTSKKLHEKVKELLRGRNRDEIFEMPFVYGQTIHYVPDGHCINDAIKCADIYSGNSDFEFEYFFDKEILALRGLTGFENALEFDIAELTPTRAVCLAKYDGKIIGIAGAAGSSVNDVWEIGVDVSEESRNAGLGTCLVKRLTKELLDRGITPFYSASVTNLGSQMVARRCGYLPTWVDTFGTILDGSSVYHDIVKTMSFDI